MSVQQYLKLSFVVAAIVFYSGKSWADVWQQAWSARISAEYDTNPSMVPTYSEGIWQSLFEPNYKLKRTGGANELSAGLALQIARSSNKTLSKDRETPSVFLNWRRQSDVGEFSISSKYAEISTRDAGIDATGLVPIDSTRASGTLSGGWSKALSERSSLSANGTYERVIYKGSTLVDNVTRSGDAMFKYAWNDHRESFLKMSYAEYRPVGGGLLRRFANAIFGWNWEPSDYLGFTLQVGKSKLSGRSVGTQGVGSIQYTGQRTHLALNAGRQITPSGLGGFVHADQMNGSLSYDLSEHSSAGISIGWSRNRSITDDVNRTSDVWWQSSLSSSWGVRMHYRHRIHEGGAVSEISSNMVGLSLAYTSLDF